MRVVFGYSLRVFDFYQIKQINSFGGGFFFSLFLVEDDCFSNLVADSLDGIEETCRFLEYIGDFPAADID